MEVLFGIMATFFVGYAAGTFTSFVRNRKQDTQQPQRCCETCRYCFPISRSTKDLMPKAYADKSCCIMGRGNEVPVGYYAGDTISTVESSAFCDQWKERVEDG